MKKPRAGKELISDCEQVELLESISIAISLVDRISQKRTLNTNVKRCIRKAYRELASAYQKVGV